MKLITTLMFALFVLSPCTFAQTQGDALDRVKIGESEYIRLLAEIKQLGLPTTDDAWKVELTDPLDRDAYQYAEDQIAYHIGNSVRELAAMKPMIIRYSLLSMQPEFSNSPTLLKNLAAQYTSNVESHYQRAIKEILETNRETRKRAMDLCVTEICVARIQKIIDDFVQFGFDMNRPIKFKNLNEETRIFWNFDNPFLKTSFAKAFHQMVPANQEASAFKAIAAGLYAPLSVVGVTTFNLLKGVGDIRWLEISLSAKACDESPKEFRRDADSTVNSEMSDVSTENGRDHRRMEAQNRHMANQN